MGLNLIINSSPESTYFLWNEVKHVSLEELHNNYKDTRIQPLVSVIYLTKITGEITIMMGTIVSKEHEHRW